MPGQLVGSDKGVVYSLPSDEPSSRRSSAPASGFISIASYFLRLLAIAALRDQRLAPAVQRRQLPGLLGRLALHLAQLALEPVLLRRQRRRILGQRLHGSWFSSC